MSVDAHPPTSPTPIPPALGEFDLLHETAGHPLLADLLQRAMGDDYPVDVDPSSSCTRSLLAHILEMLALRPGDLLVDLGCGRGGPGLWLARETGAHLVGLDFSPKGIALATRTAERFALSMPAHFRVASFDATGLPDASAGGVVSVDALPFEATSRELRTNRQRRAPCSLLYRSSPRASAKYVVMPTKKKARRRIPPIVVAVARPVSLRLSRIEDLLIEMRAEQDVKLKRIKKLQEKVDELTETIRRRLVLARDSRR